MKLKSILDGVREIAEQYKSFCVRCYGEGVVSYSQEALENAIASTEKIHELIIRKHMPEGTQSLDLHKTQTAFIVGFTMKHNCAFAAPTKEMFHACRNDTISDTAIFDDVDLQDPNTEFVILILRHLSVFFSRAQAADEECWKNKIPEYLFDVIYPDNIRKSGNTRPQKFIGSLRKLISRITDAQLKEDLINSETWLEPLFFTLSTMNFLTEVSSDSVVFKQPYEYYDPVTIETYRRLLWSSEFSSTSESAPWNNG